MRHYNSTICYSFRRTMLALLLTISFVIATLASTYAATVTIKVWNDDNGNAQKSSESFINGSTTPLWINLIDISTNQIIGQGSVNSSGVATITGATNGAVYKLIITATQPALGSLLTSPSLPNNYVNTGINLTSNASGTGDNANQTGIIEITMPGSGNLTNINFGIEQLPESLSITAASQQNPNGNYKVSIVAPNALDTEDGNIWTTGTGTVVIETLPADGTLYYNGSPVTAGQSIANFNDALLLVDPNDGDLTLSFEYSIIDQAGQASPNHGTVTMPFTAPIPFNCDSYLYQVISTSASTNSTLYRYNPFTGNRTSVKALSATYNGIGYNVKDNMIWGSDNHFNRIVRIDSEANETYFTIPNLPSDSYNVGDVTEDGYLYLYTTLETKFYIIDLNADSPNYLQLVDPVQGYVLDTAPYGTTIIGYAIYDFSYNPKDKKFYSIINPGRANAFKILIIEPSDLSFSVGAAAVSGGGIQAETTGFGATFFDQEGFLYGFSNSLGKYYRINVETNSATLLSTQSPNGSNDGASCPSALAFQTDLGDAPDSYITLLNTGGPSHILSQDLLLGQNVDAEDDGQPTSTANGDDTTDSPDDEDGLTAIPPLGTSYTAYSLNVAVTNTTGADATLSGWVDFNRNGVFNSGERAQATVPNGANSATLNWTGLSGLSAGQTYIRLRLASDAAEVANPSGDSGSASNGEVEDYPLTIFLVPPPTAVPDEFSTSCSAGTMNIVENDLAGAAPITMAETRLIDPSNSSKVLSVTILDEGSFVLDPNTGIVTFTPVSSFQGASSVGYAIQDGNGLESLSTITVNVDCPLPVTLVSFEATKEHAAAQLTWSTTSESNSSHFEIERSQNGKDWRPLGQMDAYGESTALRNYAFTDPSPFSRENLYRLKMVDLDDTYTYSRIRSLHFEGTTNELAVYPNPAQEYVTLQNPEQVLSYRLIGANGQTLLSDPGMLDAQGKLQLGKLKPGVYVLKIQRKGSVTDTHKLVIYK
ncbi:putative secreted protein (Por secretion system target) [Dyadobacter jejuensis]|uniref:Putative secreted protein (Por secretion system target) n=1 Tax=Dyadobacter jejuensis TaxID=1082580 RepID=A0A316APF7_9BACT|nr:GEVED domain-containing protein [Dyadobacter jejuensis]PWJ59381.1 putative secreted protein (Por secretion system target) [Dyadobacter jejuensis]